MDHELREYLEDILAIIEHGDNTFDALRSILDEKIPKTVKRPPRKVAPAKPLTKKLIKLKAVVKRFHTV